MTTQLVLVTHRYPNGHELGAGIELTDGRVTLAAPVLRYTLGWTRDRASAYFKRRGWKAVIAPLDEG